MTSTNNFQSFVANLGPQVKRVSHGGREYLVAPASLIVPGVLNGSDGAGYYPPEENARSAPSWDGMPLVAYHPLRNGSPVSAQDPEHKEWVWQNSGLGHLRNSRNNGKLTAEAWFDEEMVKNYDKKLPEHVRILPRLTSNQPIELSTGLFVDRDESPGTCPRTGKSYTWVARNYRPDHLAVLPDQRGACSNEDGCGIVVNAVDQPRDELGRFTAGESARFEGESADRTVSGGMDVVIIDPHSNRHEVGKTEGKGKKVRQYDKQGYSHLPKALVERPPQKFMGEMRPAKRFEAYHHTLSKIIKNQESVENSGKYGNPHHGETGKYLPHGSGTGKGESHQAAVESHKNVPASQSEEEGEPDGAPADNCTGMTTIKNTKETDMAGTTTVNKMPEAERRGMVEKLVANCRCGDSKPDVEVLNKLSDAALLRLNEMASEPGDGEDSSVEENAPKKKLPPQFAKNANITSIGAVKPQTAKEWLESAPVEIRGAVTNALKVERRAKEQLIARLTSNVAKESQEKYATFLSNKTLDELETLVELIPSRVVNASEGLFDAKGNVAPVFVGASGGFEGTRNSSEPIFNVGADPEMDPGYHMQQLAKKSA